MRLEHLRTSFLTMPQAARLDLLQHIRADRLTSKRRVQEAVKRDVKEGERQKKQAKTKFDRLLSSVQEMTPEQLATLIAAMQK